MTLSAKYSLPALVLITVFVVIPAGMIIVLSLYKTNFMTWEFVGVRNYGKLWEGSFPSSMLNSLLYMLIIPVPGIIVSTLLALSMADFTKKRLNANLFMLMLPTFAAGLIISQFWKWVVKVFGINMAERFPGVPFIGFAILTGTLGTSILIISVAIKDIDPSQYEAAMLDGASWAQIKTKIILPQIAKTVSVVFLFSLVGGLQVWETISILAPYESTASMMFRVITDGFVFGKYGLAAAECVIMAIIIILITRVKERIEKAK